MNNMQGSMAQIADGAMTPIRKSEVRSIPLDAKSAGNSVANQVIATAMTQASTWHGFAMQLIGLPVEGRTQFVTAIDAWLKDARGRNAEAMGTYDREGKSNPTKDDTKLAGKRVSSATVQISKLRTIANAFNSGGSLSGLVAYFGTTQRLTEAQLARVSVEDIGLEVIVEYARLFSESKAGRKADAWVIKFAKWLEKNPAPEDDAEGQAMWKAAAELIAAK